LLDVRKRGLLGGSREAPQPARLRIRGLRGSRRRCYGRWQRLGELLDEGERPLQLLLVALEGRKLGAFGSKRPHERVDLRRLSEGNAAQLLDVALAPDVHAQQGFLQDFGDTSTVAKRWSSQYEQHWLVGGSPSDHVATEVS